jgi:uncharacterized protein YwgA
MNMKLQDFMCFLQENKLIDLDNILRNDEIGCINRLKVQKYVYLAQTCLGEDFGYEYNIYNNGPYSPELANYYYEKMKPNIISANVKTRNRSYDNGFADKFLALFGDKEPEWLVMASTLVDSTNYFEDEKEILNKVYVMKSDYSRDYIDDVWNELKDKNLVQYKTGLKLNNRLSVF